MNYSLTNNSDNCTKILDQRSITLVSFRNFSTSISEVNYRRPQNYWKIKENHVRILKSIGNKLGIKKETDWYGITTRQIRDHGGNNLINCDIRWILLLLLILGGTLLSYYKGSSFNLITSIFPNYEWDYRQFKLQRNHLSSKENQMKLLKRIGSKIGVRNELDWYNVTRRDIVRCGGMFYINSKSNSNSNSILNSNSFDLIRL